TRRHSARALQCGSRTNGESEPASHPGFRAGDGGSSRARDDLGPRRSRLPPRRPPPNAAGDGRITMSDVITILAEVRSLSHRGDPQAIVARYGTLDDTPEDETWNSTELLYEIGRAFGMLGNEDKVERYLLRCAELAPRRAAVFHCAIGWY